MLSPTSSDLQHSVIPLAQTSKETDLLAEEERLLVLQLKDICDENGKETDPSKSVPIFQELGKLYQSKKAKISLIKSAALYNASLVRALNVKNKANIKKDLQQLCSEILHQAKAKDKNADLIEKANLIKHDVVKMRIKVKKALKNIPKIQENVDKKLLLHLESNKVHDIMNLQDQIAKDYLSIMFDVACFCEEVMGNPPCRYAVVGLGSLARQEITPYSDFEHAIVLENLETYAMELEYFEWFSVIFQVIVINIQETMLRSVLVGSLNDDLSERYSWFFDTVTPRGISFDGMMPHACKFPLGRRIRTKNKPWITGLIKPVDEMLQYLNNQENLKNGYHLGDILSNACFVLGDLLVYKEFQYGVKSVIESQAQENFPLLKRQVVEDLNNFATALVMKDEGHEVNVKRDVYRSSTLFITALGRQNRVFAQSCFDIVLSLKQKRLISELAKHKLMYAIAVACEIRLRWYMRRNKQCDTIHNKTNNIETFENIVGKASTVTYFQISYALQSEVAVRFGLKDLRCFYSHPRLLNINLCLMFKKEEHLQVLLNSRQWHRYNDNIYPSKVLFNFEKCMDVFEEISLLHPLRGACNLNSKEKTANNFHFLGVDLFSHNQYNEALKFYTKALILWHELEDQQSSTSPPSVPFSYSLNIKGGCWQLHFGENAESHQGHIVKKFYTPAVMFFGDDQRNVNGNKIQLWLNMATCLFQHNKPNEALDFFEKALQMQLLLRWNKIEKFARGYRDQFISKSIFDIARCLFYMGNYSEAFDYLQCAIGMMKRLPQPLTQSESIQLGAIYLVSGSSLIGMNKLSQGRDDLEKAFTIAKAHNVSSSGPGFTSKVVYCGIHFVKIITAIAKSFVLEKNASYAIENSDFLLQSADGMTLDYSNRVLALDLLIIGRYLQEEKEFDAANNYFKASLEMLQKLSENVEADIELAHAYADMGNCLSALKNFKSASFCFYQSLFICKEVRDSLSFGKTIANHDNNFADLDKTIADLWFKMGECSVYADDVKRGISYFNNCLEILSNLSMNTIPRELEIYEKLISYYSSMHRYEEAGVYSKRKSACMEKLNSS